MEIIIMELEQVFYFRLIETNHTAAVWMMDGALFVVCCEMQFRASLPHIHYFCCLSGIMIYLQINANLFL